MRGLQIKNETVYVIYRNGEPYKSSGRKLVYTTKGAANGVITNDARDEAEYGFDKECREKGYNWDWFDLTNDAKEMLIDEVKKEFEIVEYTPKGK